MGMPVNNTALFLSFCPQSLSVTLHFYTGRLCFLICSGHLLPWANAAAVIGGCTGIKQWKLFTSMSMHLWHHHDSVVRLCFWGFIFPPQTCVCSVLYVSLQLVIFQILSSQDYVLGFFQHALHLILIHYVSLANSMLTSLTRYSVAVSSPLPPTPPHTQHFQCLLSNNSWLVQ